jgi:hypothetical protein
VAEIKYAHFEEESHQTRVRKAAATRKILDLSRLVASTT